MNFSHCAECLPELPESFSQIISGIREMPERERERVSLCTSIPGETSGAFTEVVVTPTFASTTLQETANPLPSSLLFPICKQKNQIVVLRWLSEKNQIHIFMARMGLFSYFLIFMVGPSLLHSYSRRTQPNRKPTKNKNPLPGDRLESSYSSSLDRECSISLGRIPHHKSSYSQRE